MNCDIMGPMNTSRPGEPPMTDDIEELERLEVTQIDYDHLGIALPQSVQAMEIWRDTLQAKALPLLRQKRAENARLREALEGLLAFFSQPGEGRLDRAERIDSIFLRETGFLAPGKSQPAAMQGSPSDEERRAAWDKWVDGKVETARAALDKT